MNTLLNFLSKLGSIDRRVIFLLVGLSVLLPLLYPLNIPITITNHSRQVFEAIESLDSGSKILISFEYGPSTKPEIHPMAIALLRQLFSKDHQVYGMALWPDGLFMSNEAFSQVAENEFHLKYGVDYVNLGFKPGNEAVVKGVASDLRKMYPADTKGNSLDKLPIMKGI